jgi:hypothetical protein
MANIIKELLIKFLEVIGLAFWIEVKTDKPTCIYYFGPFLSKSEAIAAQSGYIEDLQNEGTQGINAIIKRCKPQTLTIFDEVGETGEKKRKSSLKNFSYEG